MSQSEPTYSFGVWVKARRRAIGLTQRELAERAGVAEVTVRKIEADERRPSAQVAALLADRLQLDAPTRTRFLLAARVDLSPDQLPQLAAAPRAAAPPLPPTPLVGREDDLEALRGMLADDTVRLLTLTGPPGIGKTRLALELAHDGAGRFAGAVTFVSLAPLSDPELVTATLAQALEVALTPGKPLVQCLVAHLQGRQLLVLDNFEQVLPAAGVVAELLASCADLRLVITSRAALRLRAEHEYAVPPLALPAPDGAGEAGLAAATASPAVRLFVARARAVSHAFRLTAANAPAVAAICRRLDALPLAIELAAARTRSLSLPTLLERLDRHLDLLTDGPPDLPSRQRTLRGAIVWSYELLGAPERRLLEWLGTFVGGFALDDLERTLALAAAAGADEPPADDAGAILGTLLDHSLARAEADEHGALRFRLLETVRAFARERLEARGGLLARRCHAEHFRALAAELGALLTTGERGAALARLEGEIDNLRAAFDWALGAGDDELAVGLALGAQPLWVERGRLAEGRAWAARLLAIPALGEPSRGRALALHAAAAIALHEGDHAAGLALAREALAVAALAGDPRLRAEVQGTLVWGLTQQGDHAAALGLTGEMLACWRAAGDAPMLPTALAQEAWVHTRLGAYAAARPLLEEAVALLRGGPHTWLLGEVLWDLSELARLQGDEARGRALLAESLGLLERAGAAGELPALLHLRAWQAYREGAYHKAAALFDENAALLRRRGETIDLAWAINHAAAARHCAGDIERAAAGYAESLALFRAHGHRQGEAAMLHNLGYTARRHGDLDAAAAMFATSLATFRAIGHTWSVADAVAGLAGVAAERGDAALAAQLIAAVDTAHAALDASGGLLDPSNVLEVGRTRAAIAARLPQAGGVAPRDARPLSLDEAADLAATV